MGTLVHIASSRKYLLEAEQAIGRGSNVRLRLDREYVSNRHAELRFRDGVWCVKDLGSANGSFVNDLRIGALDWTNLHQGDVLAFGDQHQERWLLEDAEPPRPLMITADSEQVVEFEAGFAAIPADEPVATVYRDEQGQYWSALPDQPPAPLSDQQTIEVGGVTWRLSEARSASTTAVLARSLDVRSARLVFRHSPDWENIELTAEVGHERFLLGAREHHLLLLVLARQIESDRKQGLPESACGWLEKEELLDQLKVERTQLNTHMFRIRKQFGLAGFNNAFEVFDQRLKTRQIRLGVRQVQLLEV